MTIQINPFTKISLLDPAFVQLLNTVIKESSVDTSKGVILNFRDPAYNAESGGFHPMELSVSSKGDLLYLTDFAYFGMPPFVELGIELDWNFEQDSFRQGDSFFSDLACGRNLLGMYTKNFTAYYRSGVYEVEVTPF